MPSDLEKAVGLCDEHQPTGGSRNCVICGLMEMSRALSRIDYLLGDPNLMEVSDYDVHANPQVVVERLKAFLVHASAEAAVAGERINYLEAQS